MAQPRKILVLGASGLIGRFVTDDLRARGFQVIGVARRFRAVAKDERARSGNAGAVDGFSRAGAADRGSRHRRRGQLPRRAAGRPRQRHARRASRFRRAAAAGDRRQRPRDPSDPYLDSRRGRRRPHRLQPRPSAKPKRLDRGVRHRLCDPAAGLCDRAIGLWRQRDAARAGGAFRSICRQPNPRRRFSRSRSRISRRRWHGSRAAKSPTRPPMP